MTPTHDLTLFTIGVYGSTEESFFGVLVENGIELFCDVRARRGVRGSEYTYANSTTLQARLAALGIGYRHLKELAPSEALRNLQSEVDKQAKVAKRKRTRLSEAYITAYTQEVLTHLDAQALIDTFDVQRVCFFCVEVQPEACHRSLLVNYLASQLGLSVKHL
jgi:uncharacterized protein (DUF488 family)